MSDDPPAVFMLDAGGIVASHTFTSWRGVIPDGTRVVWYPFLAVRPLKSSLAWIRIRKYTRAEMYHTYGSVYQGGNFGQLANLPVS
jgi:hypothetical protein